MDPETNDELTYEERCEIEQRRKRKQIKAALDILSQEVNYYGSESVLPELLAAEISNMHRTVQQGFIGIILTMLHTWGKRAMETSDFDLRNEASLRYVNKELSPFLKKSGILFDERVRFPLI